MKLYLVQHGEAKSEQEDPKRPLNEQGHTNVSRSAGIAARLSIAPEEILHSGKTRAQETAEILGRKLSKPVRQANGLAPNDPVDPWKARIEQEERDLMLVGHLPFMEKLASALLTCSPDAGIVKFRMGGVVCLDNGDGRWRLQWIIWPEMGE